MLMTWLSIQQYINIICNKFKINHKLFQIHLTMWRRAFIMCTYTLVCPQHYFFSIFETLPLNQILYGLIVQTVLSEVWILWKSYISEIYRVLRQTLQALDLGHHYSLHISIILKRINIYARERHLHVCFVKLYLHPWYQIMLYRPRSMRHCVSIVSKNVVTITVFLLGAANISCVLSEPGRTRCTTVNIHGDTNFHAANRQYLYSMCYLISDLSVYILYIC